MTQLSNQHNQNEKQQDASVTIPPATAAVAATTPKDHSVAEHNKERSSISSRHSDRSNNQQWHHSPSPSLDEHADEALTHTVTGTPSLHETTDFPDGGTVAWTQALMGHFAIFNTFGYICAFGVFQTYYTTTLSVDVSAISWLGSVQIFLVFCVGIVSGRLADAGYFRPVYAVGAVLQIVGVFCTAQSTEYWQLFLSQGVCTGLGQGLHFTPAMALVTTYFRKRRAFACGIAAVGSCTGGVVFPVIAQQMLYRNGFQWTVRTMGFVMIATNALTMALFRPRAIRQTQKGVPLVQFKALKEPAFAFLVTGMFFVFWGLYFAFFYVGSFGRTQLGLSYSDSVSLLLTTIVAGVPGRLIPNYIADRVGPLNTIMPFAFLGSIMMWAWISVHSRAQLFAFAAFYGVAAGGTQSLWPPVLASLTKPEQMPEQGARMGMGFTIVGLASLTGPPLAGALITARDGDYLYSQIWGACSFLVGGLFLAAARYVKVGWHLGNC